MEQKRTKLIWFVILMVLGEFLILLDAGFVGYLYSTSVSLGAGEIISFWVLLIFGVCLRYFAEKVK